MATERLTSLGDSTFSDLIRVRATRPLPKSRPEIVAEVGRILEMGMVQKVVVEVGKPIFFERMARNFDDAELEVPEPLEAGDIYGAMRNNELLDFPAAGLPSAPSHGSLFRAFRLLASRKLVAKAFIVSNFVLLGNWLGLGELDAVDELYGVPVYRHEEVPPDVLILVAVDSADLEEVKLSLRIPMD